VIKITKTKKEAIKERK